MAGGRMASSGWMWILAAAISMGAHMAASAQVAHGLRVSRFVGVDLPDREVNEIFARMGEILQDDAGPDDVACGVQFSLRSPVGAFRSYGQIITEGDLDAINNAYGPIEPDVKVVLLLQWCPDERKIKQIYWGCSDGRTFVALDLDDDEMTGIVWAHEFGHVKGLDHRDVPGAVMHERFHHNNQRVNESECRRFRDTSPRE